MEPPPHGAQSYVILLLWPLLILLLYRNLPFQKALIWSVVASYLFLPAAWVVNIPLPLLPSLDKNFIPALAILIVSAITLRQVRTNAERNTRRGQKIADPLPYMQPGILPRTMIGLILVTLMIGGVFLTILANSDSVVYGFRTLPGLGAKDAIGAALNALVVIAPLLLGRKFLSDDRGHRSLLTIIAVAALGYSLLALYEIRMSPQLNNMVYGFFPHSFAQHIRPGGFRPLVFLEHGLLLGIFFSCAAIAVAILIRMSTGAARFRYALAFAYLVAVLYLSKTLGAMLIAMLMLPVALLMPIRLQLITAALIAGAALTYPIIRGANLVPLEHMLVMAESFDEQRAASLGFRFYHEDKLLQKANERPVFGWGTWGRWRIYDEDGQDVTVSDGEWVITLAEWGWVGYIAKFGLLGLPLILFTIRQRRYEVGFATSGLCLIIAANIIDLIPNSAPSPVIWLAAGALLGRMEGTLSVLSEKQDALSGATQITKPAPLRQRGSQQPAALLGATDPDAEHASRYSRFPYHKRRRTDAG
jgi:hypothetical protein